MVCIYCGASTDVVNSRPQKRSNQVWRRRRCSSCGSLFTTAEALDYASAIRVASQNEYKPFLVDLLYSEVYLCISHRKNAYIEARELTNTVIQKVLLLKDGPVIRASDISSVVSSVLKRFDKRAWHRFVSEHPSLG